MKGKYLEVPGSKTHELPPLLVHSTTDCPSAEGMDMVIDEAEDMLAASDAAPDVLEYRRLELCLQLREQYKGLVAHWQWGDSIIEWIRQCEITFENEQALRSLLHPDVWPHAGRASFVTLLAEKDVRSSGITLERAVGMRLAFRQPPPIECVSSQFLFYLNGTVARTAYETWSHLLPQEHHLFPPERFHFDVVNIG